MKKIKSVIYSTNKTEEIDVKEILYENKTFFHNVVIADTFKYGKTLVIDDVIQTTEKDHEIYDSAILEPLKDTDKNILMMGGGSGFVEEYALNKNPNVHMTVVDLDIEVILACRKFLNSDAHMHPQITLIIGDIFNYFNNYLSLNSNDTILDGIVCDLTDTPVGGSESEQEFRDFFKNIVSTSKDILKKDGWISIQAGSTSVSSEYIDTAKIIREIVSKHFSYVTEKEVDVPSFGELSTFIYAKK